MQPLSAYGRTKAMIESMLIDHREAYGFASIGLRYFNVVEADFDGELGERHEPETHFTVRQVIDCGSEISGKNINVV